MNELETRLLDYLLSGESTVLETLRQQLEQVIDVDRVWTPLGLEITFDLSEEATLLEDLQKFQLSDVYALFEGISPDPGLVLWIDGGKISRLLCYSFDPAFDKTSKLVDVYYVEVSDSQSDFDVRVVDARNEERALWSYFLHCKNVYKRTEMSR
jgi:hypothetical protein